MRATAVSMVLGLLTSITVVSGQSDIDSLKASHRLLVEAVATGNIDLFVPRIHPRALGFFKNSQLVVKLSPQKTAADMAPSLLADLSTLVSTAMQDEYRVEGDTGVVCSTFSRTPTTGMDKKKRTEYFRATYVYARHQRNWLLLSWHTSNTPLN
jgi:hypothetical protein